MKRWIVILICGFVAHTPVHAWGLQGHDITAYIAECNLTPQAAAKVDKILDGYSPVYWCNWMDVASHTPEYAYTRSWHYLNIDEGQTYESMARNPKGDVVTAVTMIVKLLKERNFEPEKEAEYLKMLIHLVGDVHCPMHSGRKSDFGGNRVAVQFFGRDTDLHSAWDSSMVYTAHKWSYTEWQKQLDRLSKEEIAQIERGEPSDWLKEAHDICIQIYADTPAGTNISYNYMAKYTPVVEKQLLYGGYRLAGLLNEIYQ
ncbi:MAG: S1/P1 nuclease [Alistipes sp.]